MNFPLIDFNRLELKFNQFKYNQDERFLPTIFYQPFFTNHFLPTILPRKRWARLGCSILLIIQAVFRMLLTDQLFLRLNTSNYLVQRNQTRRQSVILPTILPTTLIFAQNYNFDIRHCLAESFLYLTRIIYENNKFSLMKT